ncbi:MAG: hypothetical protein K5Q68_15030 [Roseococcus sp.]|nr:hypothetical protein [Roseococcus sp.]
MDELTVRVKSPLMIYGERHEIGAFVQLPEDQAEELVALGVVEVMPEAPAAEGGKKKSAQEKAGK